MIFLWEVELKIILIIIATLWIISVTHVTISYIIRSRKIQEFHILKKNLFFEQK
jgi:hypothetical protein